MDKPLEKPQETLLERLEKSLHPEDFTHYQKMHSYHFWEWKMHRICQEGSLRGLRYFLYRAGVVTLERARAVDRSRPFHEYADELGFHLDKPEGWRPFSGLDNPENPPRQEFLNPGNCLELYEGARPGWVMHGYGEHLTYSLEHTLLNCLHEQLRGDSSMSAKSYQCPTFYTVLKTMEIWSVADFVIGMRGGEEGANEERRLAPFSLLFEALSRNEGGMPWKLLMDAEADTRELLDANRPGFEPFGEEVLFGTMLGFLIDELVARSAVPNGMGHSYAFVFSALSVLKTKMAGLRKKLKKNGSEPEELERIIDGLVEQSAKHKKSSRGAPGQLVDENWRRLAVKLADELRSLGFEFRKRGQMDDEEADLVFSASNAIWRWVFFLEQRDGFDGLSPSLSTDYDRRAVSQVWRWLRRPWGILTIADIGQAFRGLAPGDENDHSPRAFSVLVPILKIDIEDHMAATFGIPSKERAQELVRRLISCRVHLFVLRHLTRGIKHERGDGDDAWVRAHTLIDLLLTWVYENDSGVLDKLSFDINELPKLLRSGEWMREFVRRVGDPTSRWSPAIVTMIDDYLRDPQHYISGLFRLDEPKFRVEEWIGVFPPESFLFQSRATEAHDEPADRAE